jgi:hypothetical protein
MIDLTYNAGIVCLIIICYELIRAIFAARPKWSDVGFMKLHLEESARCEQIPFRPSWRVLRDQLPKAIIKNNTGKRFPVKLR